MDRNKILLVPWLCLIFNACSPAEPSATNKPSPTSANTPTATITVTPQVTFPEPTGTPTASMTPSPEVVEARTEMIYHVVQVGETTRDIAKQYQLSEDSIIYSNFEVLPQELAPGMTLIIPPVDGFYYMIKAGESLPQVSHRFGVSLISILSWPENGLDLEIEDIEPGKLIFIPGGKNPHFDWSTSTISAESVTTTP